MRHYQLLFKRITPTLSSSSIRRSFSVSAAAAAAQKVERPRRSLFSVPGSDERKIQKATGLNADAVVLDLEDGVALDRKEDARELVVQTLRQVETGDLSFGTSELCVRINALETGSLAFEDLQAILPCPSLQTIVLPKVELPSDVDFVRRLVEMIPPDNQEETRDLRIIAAIESAKGMLNLREIAETTNQQSSSSLDALVFASEDYCADLELIRTTAAIELLMARSQLVTTAKAYGLQAIDMVHIDFRNMEALQEECTRGVEMGFTGKQAIHPAQLDTIHQTFCPSAKDLEFAQACVTQYESTTAAGKGAVEVHGIVVDAPVYKWALKIVRRAEQAGMIQTI
ncbi:lyase subunit beta-like protein, mitochondrial [Seminavis robusta]|uniref:Lyase subunit beta-like protein, mitochondrial n=1 Tax=Seminavis robusta TaxID=568900 RepID=A0A9N8DPZ1_9STRA|nr:lyase subunit beta-like protein, mitochondrial [Seminavis robusta]|eukprot:Sro202_g085400.1 lyase subunit beta-like protein, mitochondrial (342) ;mRNA; f:44461-45486